MEIDKAIKEAGDKRLKKKYDNAIYVIQRALALYSLEEIALSFNGGKDSTVLLHLLRAGYYLLKRGESQYLMNPEDDESFPIRTIYFASQSIFPQINSFTYDMASVYVHFLDTTSILFNHCCTITSTYRESRFLSSYKLKLDVIHVDLKSGLEALLKGNPIRAIFLGVRIGDPTAVGQEQFSPSSAGWPPFMRVNPILDWSYRDIWAFLLTCKIQYCSLYDQGYTSIGSVHDTSPNELLYDTTESGKTKYKPAYLLHDGRFERAGRVRKLNSSMLSAVNNGLKCEEPQGKSVLTASIISVGDEILSGCVEDCMGSMLCRKLNSIGWAVSHLAVTQNELDSVADEVEKQKSTADIVFIYGGVGPLHSDVAVAGVAKAFGVRMAPDEEFEEYLRHLIGEKFSGDGNEMAHLPEGITELLHHEKLYVPLIKCENVILFAATNALELENEWDCLIDLMGHNGVLVAQEPFLSTSLETTLSDVVVAQPLSQIRTKFPNLYIGAYRKTREGSLIITIRGKDELRIGAAAEALSEQLSANSQAERN